MIDGLEIQEHIRTCQNLVFKASTDGEVVALRLTAVEHRSAAALGTELDLLMELQQVTGCTISPRPFRSGCLIEAVRHEGVDYNAVLFPFIEGPHAVVTSFDDAARFGELLAELHTALEAVCRDHDLPVMDAVPHARDLIHGDFNPSNVLQGDHALVVIDFENACYSTREFELANALYMQLFADRGAVETLVKADFARGFLAGYGRRRDFAIEQVREAIDIRVSILADWLRAPETAPRSVSTSSHAWRAELSRFVRAYESDRFEIFLASIS